MEELVYDYIKKHHLLNPNTVVVVGVSGGSDSLALLHLLDGLRQEFNLTLVAAHVDHMFRGKQSHDDLKYVQQFCEDSQITFEGTQIDVVSYQNEYHKSAQVAARECRYHFFKKIMNHYHASYLALGHHGDDQVETFFMRVVRGSFTTGLTGIPYKRPFGNGEIIRPLLGVTKSQIGNYCNRHDIVPREDPSNEKDDYVRNRFRKYVLPFVKEENPSVHKRIEYINTVLKDDEQYLLSAAAREIERTTTKANDEMTLNVEEFGKLPISLQRRGIHLILKYLYQQKNIDANLQSIHIESLLKWLESDHPSGQIDLPNELKAIRSYHSCLFSFKKEKIENLFDTLEVPGDLLLPNGYSLSAEWVTNHHDIDQQEHIFICGIHEIELPIIIRSRKPGDRMTLKGMSGTKKVKDIFINKKVPLTERDHWPIIEDQKGNILWIPLIKKSRYEPFHLNHDTQYLLLKYTKNENN